MQIDTLLAASALTLKTETETVALEPASPLTWRGGGFTLDIRVEKTPAGMRLYPTLRNERPAVAAIESVEILHAVLDLPDPLRFLYFGLTMPGDITRFGVMDRTGVRPALTRVDKTMSGSLGAEDNDTESRIRANGLMVLATADRRCLWLVGAGTFRATEGTVWLSCQKATGAKTLQYEMVLDGVHLSPGAQKELDEVVLFTGSDLNDLLARWADYTAGKVKPRIPARVPTGWSDWQFYREEKTQEQVLASAAVIADLRQQGYPLDFIQVDGGFCLYASEWSAPKPAFADGIKSLSEKIRALGLQFSLWFAPYIQNVNTRVVQEHPEWLLQKTDGSGPVRLRESNVGASFLLDYSIPEAIDWLRRQLRLFVKDWQVRWIKLDGPAFWYYRMGRPHDRSLTLSEMLARSFQVIREEAGPDVLVEGEGILGLALGNVDLHRVQTDNSQQSWYRQQDTGEIQAPMVYGKELIMAFLHGRWWCNHRENVVLRDCPSPYHACGTVIAPVFTEDELRTHLVAAVLGSGGLLLTDPMKELQRTPHRLRYASQILPVWPEAARMVDVFPDARYPSTYRLTIKKPFETYAVAGVINWSDEIRDFQYALKDLFPEVPANQACHVFSYFDRQYLGAFRDTVAVRDISAHGCKLLAIRPVQPQPQLLSTGMHFLQGAADVESVAWNARPKRLTITVNHFEQSRARLYVIAPDGWRLQAVQTNARKHTVDDFDRPVYGLKFEGAADRRTRFDLDWTSS